MAREQTPSAFALGFAGGIAAAGAFVGLCGLHRKRQKYAAVGQALASTKGTRTNDCVYLDYNGTSPIFPEVASAMQPFCFQEWGNPSSGHAYGLKCRAALVNARAQVAEMLRVTPAEVTFTSCGSESDNWAIRIAIECFRQHSPDAVPHIVTSAVEHVAVLTYLRTLEARGTVTLTVVAVDRFGRVAPAHMARALKQHTALVTIMHSNNEMGALQSIRALAEAVRDHASSGAFPEDAFVTKHVLFHTDAAQSCGKVTVNAQALGADMLTIVGHKFGAPKGVAALYIRDGCARGFTIEPSLHGGGQESGLRAGTENVMLAVALGAAAAVARAELFATASHMRSMRLRLVSGLETRLGPCGARLEVHGPESESEKLPNTLSFGVRGVRASAVVKELGQKVAFSAGSACHEGETKMSAVLAAMGVAEELGLGTMRLSVGRHTTAEEVDRAAVLVGDAIARQLQQ